MSELKVRSQKNVITGVELFRHGLLFLLTLGTTTIAGMLWQGETDFLYVEKGLIYSVTLLFILSCHEFGHYFAARHHNVKVSLPYYIPFPPFPQLINFGSLGAVIRMREPIPTRTALFDIGIAGPIAGFLASILVLAIGFMTLPGPEFIQSIHPGYDFTIHTDPTLIDQPVLTFGTPLLYTFFSSFFSAPGAYIPPMSEMYHYPFLVTGWFGLLVTALNLLPAGQLDGGHILYAMFGTKHRLFARLTVAVLFISGFLGLVPLFLMLGGLDSVAGISFSVFQDISEFFWPGWLFWAVLITLMKVDHPPVTDDFPLTAGRMKLGWSTIGMFVLSIAPAPIFFL